MKDIKNKTVRAMGWVLLSKVTTQALSFCFGIVLARLLVPDDFGLMVMVSVFIGFASLFADVGFGQALIQKQNAHEAHYSSIFWMNCIVAVFLAGTMYFSAHAIADFYHRPELIEITQVVSIVFIIGAISFIPRVKLTKKLEFKTVSLAELWAMMLSGVVAIFLAKNGYGYWSLLIHKILQQVIIAVILVGAVRWLPKPMMRVTAIRDLFNFSASVFGTRLLQFFSANTDKVMLGKYLGASELGIYDKAQSMMFFPLTTISHSVGSVMFPSLSLIQDDKERVRNIYLRSVCSIALVTFPMMAGMFVVADAFVYGVLGEQWEEIIPILKIFCIAGLFSSIAAVTGNIYLSQGAAGLQFRVNLVTQPLKIVCVLLGLYWGAQGVAVGFVVAIVINTVITLTIAGSLIHLKLSRLLMKLAPILLPSILMAGVVHYGVFFLQEYDPLSQVMLQAILGIFVYWLLLGIFRVESYRDIVEVMREQVVGRK